MPASRVSVSELNALTPQRFAAILAGPAASALPWLRAAAEAGLAEAQAVLGQWLLDGRGQAADPCEAAGWFARAAEQQHPMAMNMLGRCLRQGWGVEVNLVMAAYWFGLAAQAGLAWGMYNYATALALGEGVPQARGQALHWLQQAADQGHAKSLNLLGGFHEDGWEVQTDLGAALALYRRAAAGGDFRGAFNCARLLARQGGIDEALTYLDQVPAGATPAFLAQAAEHLLASHAEALRARGRAFTVMLNSRAAQGVAASAPR